ncbi:MAG: hypothetical protein HYS81_01820 [Candidatus Aenigmatarchaeota archaeon]|nr:MAG: hypothetical protein HYS81_01820 [Candidatus Aenigmarchaeota archaeon]
MDDSYILTTESGNEYIVIHEKHILGGERWMISADRKGNLGGKKQVVLGFGDIRALKLNVGGQVKPERQAQILEADVGKAIKSKSCIGKAMFFISNARFGEMLLSINRMKSAEEAMALITKAAGNSTRITKVMVGMDFMPRKI